MRSISEFALMNHRIWEEVFSLTIDRGEQKVWSGSIVRTVHLA